MKIYDYYLRICESNRTPQTFQYQVVLKIKSFLQQHFNQKISLSDIGAHIKKNNSYGSKLFHKYMGYSILDYVHRLRVESSKKLLVESSATIAEISEQLGYADRYQFSKIFKKYVGLSPKQYQIQKVINYLSH